MNGVQGVFPDFAPQCCDANGYLELGRRCALQGECWDPLRPIGMTLYASLPLRLGLPQETLVLFNLALLALSVIVAARFLRAFWPVAGRTAGLARHVFALVPHVVFLWAACFNSLSDVPAAALLLSGLCSTCITVRERRGVVAAAFAGALLGASAFVRLSYLYPVLATGGTYGFLAAWGTRIRPRTAVPLVLALIVPLAWQAQRTHAHTGTWSYIDESVSEWLMSVHLDSTLYGYDTLVPPWQPPSKTFSLPHPDLVVLQDGSAAGYDARSCCSDHLGLVPALRDGDVASALCLVAKRQAFYFDSYTPLGAVYLPSPDTRIWSRWFRAPAFAALALTLVWAARSAAGALSAVPLVLLSAIWVVSTISVPEGRFFVTVHIFLWVVASGVLASWLLPSWRRAGSARRLDR